MSRPPHIPESLWTAFITVGAQVSAAQGELLWEPGNTRETMYIVLRGLIRLYHPDHKGTAVTLLTLGAGALLGQHAPHAHHHPVGAEALCHTELLKLPARHIKNWTTGQHELSPVFTEWLHDNVSQQLDETYQRLELEHEPALNRVAHAILILDAQALLDRMSRQQIADITNLSPETVVRSITQLRKNGQLKSAHFTALNNAERQALRALIAPYELAQVPYA